MEMLVGLLTGSSQLNLQDQKQGMSLDDMAQMASSNLIQRTMVSSSSSSSSSLLAGREDSLVFMLGLLNLGTVLFYAIYANLFKQGPGGNHWTRIQDGEQEPLFKKIQTVLDELVLHVHTASYYHRREDRSSHHRQRSARTSFNLDNNNSNSNEDDNYRFYLNHQIKKMIRDWLAMTVPAESIQPSRTKRQAEFSRNKAPITRRRIVPFGNINGATFESFKNKSHLRSNPFSSSSSSSSSSGQSYLQQQSEIPDVLTTNKRRPQAAAVATVSTTTTPPPPSSSVAQTDGHHYHRQHIRRQLDFAAAKPDITMRPADEDSLHILKSSSSSPVAAHGGDYDDDDDGDDFSSPPSYTTTVTRGPPSSHSLLTRHQQQQQLSQQQQHYATTGGGGVGSGSDDQFVNRLMHLVTGNTPLTLEVLDVFRHHQDNTKCLERLLCQLNQDWKTKGSVPAALAPFLSITMGWWLDDGRSAPPTTTTTANSRSENLLSHVLMAVRAGWIGKHCAVLYPRCANPHRQAYTVVRVGQQQQPGPSPAVVEEDSVNAPSVMGQPVKIRPPAGFQFINHAPLPAYSTNNSPLSQPVTVPPHSTSAPLTSTTITAQTPTTMAQSSAITAKTDVDEENDSEESNDATEESNATTNQGADWQQQQSIDRIDSADSATGAKPWGKPSRFSVTGDVPLSDIVRGIYPPDQATPPSSSDGREEEEEEEEEDDEIDEEEEGGEEEGDEEEEEDDLKDSQKPTQQINNIKHNILHDLNRHHFGSDSAGEKINNVDPYLELQKKKTERLQMVPHRGLVHPWLAEPVWVPENPTLLADNNLLSSPAAASMNEYDDTTRDRYRDRVPFGHEDAVKDTRLKDFAMQYLRDRSA